MRPSARHYQDAINTYRRLGLVSVADEDAALSRLGLSRTGLTKDGVHAAYRRLAKLAHADTGGSADAFRQVEADWDIALRLCRQ